MQGKIAVALGGGCARGWAHIGVLKALKRAGLTPDIVVGTSIGALVGGCYAADGLDALEEFATSLTRRRVFGFLDFNLGGTGLILGRRLCQTLDSHLGDIQIENLDLPFVSVATEIGTGHEIWLNNGRLVDAMRASYALPGIFRPVLIDDRWLMDGALVNPVPVSVCRALGARVVIAINLNSEIFGRTAVVPGSSNPDTGPTSGIGQDLDEGLSSALQPIAHVKTATQLLHRQLFGRRGDAAPGISSVMMDAFNITQDRIARSRLAGDPPDLTITPDLTGLGLFDFHRADELIASGEAATERAIGNIRSKLETIAA
ncbi:MAG: patatin-like phospholipase family protein [Hyphomicrobiaceae bacterium]